MKNPPSHKANAKKKKHQNHHNPLSLDRSVLWHSEELKKHHSRHKEREKKKEKLDGYTGKQEESKTTELIKTV